MKIINFIGCGLFGILLALNLSLKLTDLGLEFLGIIACIPICLFLPDVIYRWIYKEEIEESQSQDNEEN